jgi:hypothetical protein
VVMSKQTNKKLSPGRAVRPVYRGLVWSKEHERW